MNRRKFLGCCGTLAATTTAGCSALDEAIYRTPAFKVFEMSTVKMDGAGFAPQHIQVPVGETVSWTNIGSIEHNIQSNMEADFTETWDMDKRLPPDETVEHTFGERGIYDVLCNWHNVYMRIGVDTEIDEPITQAGEEARTPLERE